MFFSRGVIIYRFRGTRIGSNLLILGRIIRYYYLGVYEWLNSINRKKGVEVF